MPLHRMIVDAISSASACSLWSTPNIPVELDRAAHADNHASAATILRNEEASLMILLHRVRTARELCECAMKDDEEAPAPGSVSRALYDGLRPQLHRFSRADLRVVGK